MPLNPTLLCSSLTVSIATQSPPSPPQSLGCSPEWLCSTLLPRLARWCEEPKLNVAVTSLRLVPVDKYNDRYQDMKARYGRRLVEVSCSSERMFHRYRYCHSLLPRPSNYLFWYFYRPYTAGVAEWVRAWDTLTMFEATVCGRS